MEDNGLLLRGRGSFIGLLAGDYAQTETRLLDSDGNYMKGFFTACGQMSLYLARSILKAGRYSPEQAAAAYQKCLNATTVHTAAISCTTIADDYDQTRLMREPAVLNNLDNDALMRSLPIALLGIGHHRSRALEWLKVDTTLTHTDSTSIEVSWLYVQLVSAVIEQGLSATDALQYVDELLQKGAFSSNLTAAVQLSLRGGFRARIPSEHQGLSRLQIALGLLKDGVGLDETLSATSPVPSENRAALALYGSMLGAIYGENAVPKQVKEALLTDRATGDKPDGHRDLSLTAVDALIIAEQLLALSDEKGA